MAEKYARRRAEDAKDAGQGRQRGATSSKPRTARPRPRGSGYTTPPIYNDIDKTPLRADVPAQTEYKFELTKDAK